jgi:hypothetical protein
MLYYDNGSGLVEALKRWLLFHLSRLLSWPTVGHISGWLWPWIKNKTKSKSSKISFKYERQYLDSHPESV